MDAFVLSALRAARSLFTPGIMLLLILCALATLAGLFGFIAVTNLFCNWLAERWQEDHFILSYFLPWIGTTGASVIAWFLFPGIMPVIVNFFDDRIARMIEKHEYPDAVATHASAFWPEFWHDVRFALMAVLLNILALPLYLVPGLNVVLFYILIGYLLGREFFIMVARRHMPVREAVVMRRKNRISVMMAGVLFVVIATIPVANVFAPFWGIAIMVHLFHLARNRLAENKMK